MQKSTKEEPCLYTKTWLFFCLLIAILSLLTPGADANTREGFVQTALEMGLHESPQWLALGHYRPLTSGGYESMVDDPEFFLHENGRRDEKAELEATIWALLNSNATDDGMHAACRYPARKRWLVKMIGLGEADLPAPACSEMEKFIQSVSPHSATLVFPESHMNSPASMFGHTLIRVDSNLESKLVSYAINYAAFTDETFGPLYAVRGIFGLYKGYFSVQPYYELINKYSNMENRDIWEYSLNLTREEVMMMTLHVWEMKEKFSYYYFFDENCSYILLFMLEVARPEAELTEGFGMWAIPIDTIRRVMEAEMVEKVTYRPSRATRLLHVASVSTPDERTLAKDISLGKQPPLAALDARDTEQEGSRQNPKASETRTLDMATEFLKYSYEQQELDKDKYTRRLLSILALRSNQGRLEYDIPEPARPEQGHGSARATIGRGWLEQENYWSLRMRPAFHGLTDPDAGFARGASISFVDIEGRYYVDQQKLELQRLDIIDITSIAPIGDFFRAASWKLNFGLAREIGPKGKSRTPMGLYVAGGLALDTPGNAIVYSFLGVSTKIAGEFEDNYALGARSTTGVALTIAEQSKALIEADAAKYMAGHKYNSLSLSAELLISLTKDWAIAFKALRKGVEDLWTTDGSFTLHKYF